MGRIDMGTPEISPAAVPALFSFKREMLAVLPSLRAFAVSLARRHDKADDLVQETVMKAWSKQESFQAGNLATHPEQYGKLDMADFKTALDTLPDDQREAIVLIGASGFSYEEAAEIAGVAVGTIKSRVNRARVKLQELLAVDGESDYGPDETSRPLVNRAFPGR